MEFNGDFYGGLFGNTSSVPTGFSGQSKSTIMNSSFPTAGFTIEPKTVICDDNETLLSNGEDSLFSGHLYGGNQSYTTRSVTDSSLHSIQHGMMNSHNMMQPNIIKGSIHSIESSSTMHNNDNNKNSSTTMYKNRIAMASEQTLLCAAVLMQNQAHQDAKTGSSHANPVTGQRKPFVYTEFNAIPSLPLELGGICHPAQISPDVYKRELMAETALTDDIVAGIVPTVYTMFR